MTDRAENGQDTRSLNTKLHFANKFVAKNFLVINRRLSLDPQPKERQCETSPVRPSSATTSTDETTSWFEYENGWIRACTF